MHALLPEREIAGLSFLVVDDDRTFLEVVAILLHGLGARRVTTARTGTDAIVQLDASRHTIDCILCDLKMPDGNGLQLLKALRTGKVKMARADTCFVFISAANDTEFVRTAARLDVNGYLVKPVTREKLVAMIMRAREKVIAVDVKQYESIAVPEDAL